jgi:uncharacterized protein with GYD domain
MKLTDQGVKNIKDFPQRIEASRKGMEAIGGKMVGFYALMGEYDYVVIAEFPSDEVGMTFALGLNALGNVKTHSMQAFTEKEFIDIVQKMP